MKLQKLLKKLALPVFALVVVGMLAACSDPAGGSDNGTGSDGGNDGTPPALIADEEYEIVFGSTITDADKTILKAAGIELDSKLTGAQIEELKTTLLAAGYTYTENDGIIIIKKKPAPKPDTDQNPSENENKNDYIIKYEDLVIGTCDKETFDKMPANTGTKDGNVAIMTSTYIDSILDGKGKSDKKEYVAAVFFKNNESDFLTQTELTALTNLLIKDTDYKISTDRKVIVLTESGYIKQYAPLVSDTDVSNEPLFDISEVTVSTTKFELTEGVWVLKKIEEFSSGEKGVKECKIEADSSGIKYTEIKKTIKDGVIPENATNEQIELMRTVGAVINGNRYSISYVAGSLELDDENEDIVKDFEGYQKYSTLKTNTNKTKYYWESSGTLYHKDPATGKEKAEGTYTEKYYLKKLSGTSTPVTLPDSGETTTVITSDGQYEGVLEEIKSTGNVKLYTTIDITYTNPTYTVKMWTSPEKTGEPYKTLTGSLPSIESSKDGTRFSGSGKNHTFEIQTADGTKWNIKIVFSDKSIIQGNVKKIAGSSSSPSDPSIQPGIDIPISNPTGIDPAKEYKLITGGDSFTTTGLSFVLMIDMYNLDENDYTVDGTTITITESGLEKMYEAAKNTYDLVYKGTTFDKIPLQSFISLAKNGFFSESEYTIDEAAKKITLSDSGYSKFTALMKDNNKN